MCLQFWKYYFRFKKRTNPCPHHGIVLFSWPFCVLITHLLLHAALTSLFDSAHSLSHPRPSGHIYVPTTISSLCLVTVAPSASSGRTVEWKKWIENTEQMCLEQSVWLHLSSVIHEQENVCYTKAVDILWCIKRQLISRTHPRFSTTANYGKSIT